VSCTIKGDLLSSAILIFRASHHVKDAFYFQMSTVYALLITCSVSLFQENITRPHTIIVILITSSPVSFCFLVYSIRAFWGEHRLDTVLGKKNHLNRGLVFFAVGIWFSIVVYASLGSTRNYFAQGSCKAEMAPELLGQRWFSGVVSAAAAAIATVSWLISIVLAREEIWPPGGRYRPKFITVW
jgi:hypothetical protein